LLQVNWHFTHEAQAREFVMTRSLPALGLGCAALGNLYAPVSDDDAAATLAGAWDGGIRLFDTAPYYGHGLSERRLGDFLRAAPRPDAIISSKVGRGLRPAGEGPPPDTGFVAAAPFEPYFDYGGDAVRRQVEDSLRRLGVDRLDIAFVHDLGALTHGPAHAAMFETALGGAFSALAALRDEGVVGAIGLGVNETAVCLETLARIDLDVILLAGRYTLLDGSAADALLPLCRSRGVRVIIGGPYNSGVLAGGDRYDYAAAPEAVVRRVRRLAGICAAHGVALPAAALQFPLRHPAVTSVIPGARSPAEVADNLAHLRAPVPEALWTALQAEGLIEADA
jgi:D-threo-aldose 1-dehydrogenase